MIMNLSFPYYGYELKMVDRVTWILYIKTKPDFYSSNK